MTTVTPPCGGMRGATASSPGVTAAGMLADLILIDGDPSARITDIDHIDLVMKGGRIFEPARIEAALGIAPARREAL